jgi:hypothetical protein
MQDLNTLIENVEKALWEMQEFFNAQPKEEIPNYMGTCKNKGALRIYQLRIAFGEKFPSKQATYCHLNHEQITDFLKEYNKEVQIYKDIRIGQSFCNRFNITNPNLFYADGDKAMEIIYSEYYQPEILDPPTEEEANYRENFGLD